MRRFLLALLIALLPLRGWAGDVMAVQMVAAAVGQQFAASQADDAHADDPAAPAHQHAASVKTAATMAAADCVDHAAANNPAAPDNSHCQSCVACQACHTVALAVVPFHIALVFISPVVPQSAAPGFTSAERALDLKPPIS